MGKFFIRKLFVVQIEVCPLYPADLIENELSGAFTFSKVVNAIAAQILFDIHKIAILNQEAIYDAIVADFINILLPIDLRFAPRIVHRLIIIDGTSRHFLANVTRIVTIVFCCAVGIEDHGLVFFGVIEAVIDFAVTKRHGNAVHIHGNAANVIRAKIEHIFGHFASEGKLIHDAVIFQLIVVKIHKLGKRREILRSQRAVKDKDRSIPGSLQNGQPRRLLDDRIPRLGIIHFRAVIEVVKPGDRAFANQLKRLLLRFTVGNDPKGTIGHIAANEII